MRVAVAFAALAVVVAPGTALAAPSEIHATVDRRSLGLGDPFTYTVEARSRDRGPLRVVADTGPFALLAAPEISRSRSGGVALVRVVQRLACLDRTCSAGARVRRVSLPPARASSGGEILVATARSVTLVPRVPASAVAASQARYRRQTDVPPPSTALSPTLLAALAAAAAAFAAAVAVLLVARELQRVRTSRARTPAAGGLALALRFLRESARRPAPDRRRAADYAARAAAGNGDDEIVGTALSIAWAPPEPAPEDVAGLADRIETAFGRDR